MIWMSRASVLPSPVNSATRWCETASKDGYAKQFVLHQGLDLRHGHDYVFIGRAATLAQDFKDLMGDIVFATQRLNDGKGDPPRSRGRTRAGRGRAGTRNN